MAKAQTPIKFTYQDYKNLPESETKRYELLEGELIPMTPSPSEAHQWVVLKIASRLDAFVSQQKLGRIYVAPLDVVLGEDVVQPDILFISHERSGVIHPQEVRGAPDLIIEILSPSTAQRDRTYKRTLYARHGVREYWLVDPDAQTIEVLAPGSRGYRRAGWFEGDQTLSSPLLKGFQLALSEVFA